MVIRMRYASKLFTTFTCRVKTSTRMGWYKLRSKRKSSVTNEDTSTSGATPSPQSPLQTAIASSMSHLSQHNNKKNCNTDLVVPVILNQSQDLQSHAFPTQTFPAMNLHVRNVQPNPIRTVSAVSIQTSPQPREGCTMNKDEGSQQARAFPLLLNSESDNLNYIQEDILFLKKRKLFLETEILEMQKRKLSLEIQSLEMDIRKKSTNRTS